MLCLIVKIKLMIEKILLIMLFRFSNDLFALKMPYSAH